MLDNCKKNESGDILVLFAGTFILLIVFLGLATDVVLAFNERDKLIEVGNLIRDARFDLSEELWNSYHPEQTMREIAQDIAEQNGLERNQVDVIWREVETTHRRRTADITVILTDTYQCTTLRMLGINELPIQVTIPGRQFKERNRVWSP
ncbi:hypothetical protein PRVXT_002390 [Proteinivorax tanatarense]|uniref:Flp pilus-assembly TadG-like N-terminal domain-containing protein n=1 Tax=Proteinivorax tanatarense TaxID=1260629 RepID=A0AAU7VK89_9FIRM